MLIFHVFSGLRRSVADSNRCNWFCRPAPSHSANRPIFQNFIIKSAADYSASRRELALFESSVRTAVTGFADQRLATRQTDRFFDLLGKIKKLYG
jgi:hypothetical protein